VFFRRFCLSATSSRDSSLHKIERKKEAAFAAHHLLHPCNHYPNRTRKTAVQGGAFHSTQSGAL
jgi:hypothetical protein